MYTDTCDFLTPYINEPFYWSSFMSYYLISMKDLFFIIQSQLKPLKEECNEQIHSQVCVFQIQRPE